MPSLDSMTILEKISNTIRCLSIDAIEKAHSGHPGMPMGCAEFAAVLWAKILKHNPKDPEWPDRDRFVLSAGHGSMLLYSALHLSGYDLSLDDLKDFRQWGSRTPGHPEAGCAPGVETTTGPLGQGFANGAGLALGEAIMAERFNRDGARLVDHYTYVLAGDGCLMEGISAEAASMAGFLKLGKLICFFDSNRITIEGSTALACSDDTAKRFESYGWHVQEIDGHDFDAIEDAIRAAQAEKNAPSLIIGSTHIAKGSPNKQDSESSHGAPLGKDEIALTKEGLGWPQEPFFVPDDVRRFFDGRLQELDGKAKAWEEAKRDAFEKSPDSAREWKSWRRTEISRELLSSLPVFKAGEKVATRAASGRVLQALASHLPNMVGGSADLGPSNKTWIGDAGVIGPGSYSGRNIHFGVREHAMGGILNGLALHGGLVPYGGTFLVFADYMRPAIRMAALSGIPVVYVFTHDSIYVGEDGPTHQPVEQIASLRAIPNLTVIRPADGTETAAAWVAAIGRDNGPTALILSRQKLPVLETGVVPKDGVAKGAYVLSREEGDKPNLTIIATGSEVNAALEAKKILGGAGKRVRIVSMPSWELFDAQPAEYRTEVLPGDCPRLAVEAGLSMGWERYADGAVIGVDRFGASAPGGILGEKYGVDGKSVAAKARELLGLQGN